MIYKLTYKNYSNRTGTLNIQACSETETHSLALTLPYVNKIVEIIPLQEDKNLSKGIDWTKLDL